MLFNLGEISQIIFRRCWPYNTRKPTATPAHAAFWPTDQQRKPQHTAATKFKASSIKNAVG